MTKDYPWGKGTPKWTRDATANDSDKSFTVPDGKIWELISAHIELAATATVGNRNLIMLITDGTNTIYAAPRGGNITASQTGVINYTREYAAMGSTATNVPLLTGAAPNAGNYGTIPLLYLPAGYIVRLYDIAAVDAAADDMTTVLHYIEYDA